MTWLLAELPVHVLRRIRSDRVLYGPAGHRRGSHLGRQPRHGDESILAEPKLTDRQTADVLEKLMESSDPTRERSQKCPVIFTGYPDRASTRENGPPPGT